MKLGMIQITILLILLTFATAQMTTDITRTERVSDTNVTYEYERIYIGTFPVYGNVRRSVLECNTTGVDERGDNLTQCGMVDRLYPEIVDYETLYKKGELKTVKIENRTNEITREGCYSCGTYLLCLDKSDGFSKERADKFKCTLRSGETGRVVPI